MKKSLQNIFNSSKALVLMLLIAFSVLFTTESTAQVNIALTATAAHSGGGATAYGPQNYNDGVIPAFGNTPWGWVSSNGWIEYTWTLPQTISSVVFHFDNRPMSSCTFQIWDGTQYVNILSYTRPASATVKDSVFLTIPVNTTKLRFNTVAGSNPNHREIQVYQRTTSFNDAGISAFPTPAAFCPSTQMVSVRVNNYGKNRIDSVMVNWLVDGIAQPSKWMTTMLDTIGGTLPTFADINLDTLQFPANSSKVVTAWTSLPNNVADTVNFNDTLASTLAPAISGNYTVNGGLATGGTNFNSFADLSTFLTANGVCGPVNVEVINKGSAYAEQISLGNINGTSATNKITIDGNGQTITAAGGSTQRATILLNGSSHIKIKNLKIEGTATTNCYGVQVTGGSEYLEFDSCQVSIDPAATSSLTAAFVVSGSLTSATTAGLSGQNLKITNCIIEGGYYGLTLTGPSSAPYNSGNVVENNIIRDAYLYQTYLGYQDSLTFTGNDIHRENRTGTITTFYGIYILGNATDLVLTNNRIHNPADQNPTASFTNYSIYMSSASATAADPALIANNAIYNLNGIGTTYAIYITTADYLNIYHNTVSLDNTLATGSSAQRALYITSTSGNFDIKNNLFSITQGGSGTKHLMYLNSTAPTYTINNNHYNLASTNGSNLFGYYGSAVSTLAAWQAVNSGAFDQNAVYGDPIFDVTAYKPQSAVGNNGGANLLSVVPADIDGMARTITPDMGAKEYVPLTCLQPIIQGGTSTATTITIDWLNDADADSVHIEYGGAGFVQGTGTMLFTQDSTITITGLNPQTCYDFYFKTYCGGSIGNGQAFFTYCTKCAAQAVPYTENFDGITASNNTQNPGLPDCWFYYKSPNHTGYGYTYTSLSPNSAPNHMRFYSGGTQVDTLAIISPAILGLTAGDKRIKFWAKSGSTAYGQRIIIGTVASPDQMNTLDIIDTVVTPTTTYADFTVYLDSANGYNGTHEYVVLMQGAINGTFQSLYVDDILIEMVPLCNPPTSITVPTIAATSAQAAWTSLNGTCFDIEYGPQGFTQGTGNGTLVTNVTSPYTMNNLSPNTYYDVYVRDCCNPNAWAGPIVFKTNCLVQLSGTYTVGGTAGPTNFATLDSAINTLVGCGVTGPVTFNLQGGTYNIASKTFGNIVGVSATNTVTFNGGGTSADTINVTSGSEGLTFDGAQYITFQNLTLNAPGANRQVWMWNNTHHITFNNCHILGSSTATSSLTCVVAITGTNTSISSTGNNANDITISNCKLVGGYYGFSAYGVSSTSFVENYTLTNNVFEDQYFYGIRFYYVKGINVTGNTVILDRNTSGYGMYNLSSSDINVKQNQFFGNTYGVYMSSTNVNGAPTTNNEFSNNFFGGGTYGLYMSTYNKVNIWHNSFRGNTSGMYALTPANVDIRNNIFVGGTSYAFYNSTNPSSGYVLDYNLYHATGTNLAYNGAAFTSLAAWQTAQSGYNVNSLSGDPLYISNTDFHILGTLPNNAGVNGLATVDIDGDVRPASGSTTVDMGADEYTPLQWDATMEDLQVSLAGCGDSATDVSVEVKNLGQNAITSLPVVVQVSGGVTATLNYTYTQTIASGATATFSVGTINTASGPSGVNFTGYTNLSTDQKTSNDTMAVGPGAYFPLVPQALMPDTVCVTADSATFAANVIPGLEYGWFANANDTVPAFMGDSLTFPLSGQQTWYLGYTGSGTQTLTTAYAGGNSCGGGVMFNITATSNLSIQGFNVSTTLGVGTAVPLTVYYIPNGTYLGNELNASAWTTHSSTTATSAGSGNATTEMLPMPLIIPAGSTYAIYLNYASAYTNGNGTNQVVSNSDMVINMGIGMCGLFTGANNPRVFNGGVIYGSEACSQIKVPVTLPLRADSAVADYSFTVMPNGADVNFDGSASQGQQYYWDFGDGGNATTMSPMHTYAVGGTYTVCLAVVDTVCNSADTTCKQVLVTVGIDEGLIGQTLNVYPNPNDGKFRVEFQVEGLKDVEIRVMSILGQTIYQRTPGNVSGTYREDIDLSSQAAGVYVLQIITEEGTVSRRVTVRK